MTAVKEQTSTLVQDVIQAFDDLNGLHPGFRPAHAKGILLSGTFTPSPAAASITRASHAQRPTTPVWVRFSDFAGIPSVPDGGLGASPRGMAIRFHLAEHLHTDIVAHSVDGFPARTAEEFLGFLRALHASGPSISKPTPIELFLSTHPSAREFVEAAAQSVPASFVTLSYFAVNAYRFVDGEGAVRYGRYHIDPESTGKTIDPVTAAGMPANFLFDDLRERLATSKPRMHIAVQLADPGDIVDDSTIRWPKTRTEIDFGTLELTGIVPNNDAEQQRIIFDPIPRVDGIEPSKDPLLAPRAEIYLESGHRRRAADTPMRRISITGSTDHPRLVLEAAPRPCPDRAEVLIQVRAAGVMATELHWYPTWFQSPGQDRKNAVPGHEFSGIIAAVGEGVSGFKVGEEVFGMNDWYTDGAMADYCVAPAAAIAAKPSRLTHVEAASVPIGALTAWQALFDHGRLQRGESVLVHGGAGGVGIFAVQLARYHGAHVMATASGRNLDFVRSLGADEVVDHEACRFENAVKQVDLVIDTVGGDMLERSWNVLAPEGRLVTVVSTAERSSDERVKKAFFIVRADHQQLDQIGALLQDGTLQPFIDAVVGLPQAADAYAGRVTRVGRGKIVVAVSDAD